MKAPLPSLATALVIGLIVGIIIGRSSSSSQPEIRVSASESSSDQNCPKYRDMYDRLRVDYLALQEDRSQNNAIAVCPDMTDTSQTHKIVEDSSSDINVPPPPVSDEDTPDTETADEEPVTKEPMTKDSSNNLQNEEALGLIANIKPTEKDLNNANSTPKQIKFLNRVKLKTPMQTINSMQPVTNKDKFLENIYGEFKGPITFTEKKRKNGKISLVVKKPENPDNKKAWVVRIDVDDGRGKVSRQNGGLEMLRTVSNQSVAYFIRSSENSYLQLFYITKSDHLLGNYHEKNSGGEYPQRGGFLLKSSIPLGQIPTNAQYFLLVT